MGLGSRTARQHTTAAAERTAGVDASAFWDFKPGQAVMTVDGFSGKVTAVNDGPLSGTESYEVTLDGGLGGGEYTSSQLTAKADAAQYTAASDYPELAEILVDRPDIAPNTKWATLAKSAGHHPLGYEQCPVDSCGDMVNVNGASMQDHLAEHGEDPDDYEQAPHAAWEKRSSFRDGHGEHDHSQPKGEHGIESFTDLEPNDGAEADVDEHGHLSWGGSAPACRDTDDYSMFGQNDAVEKAATLQWETINWQAPYVEKAASHYTADELREVGRAEEQRQGKSAEEILSAQAAEAKHHKKHHSQHHHAHPLVMHPQARSMGWGYGGWGWPGCGGCAAGDTSGGGDGGAMDGGGSEASRTAGLHFVKEYNEDGRNVDDFDGHSRAHEDIDDAHAEKALLDEQDKQNGLYRPDRWRVLTTEPRKHSSFDPWSIVTTAAGDTDFRFEVTAAWSDVRSKAKRIRAEGGVHVTLATEGIVVGEVKGDHNVYETGIQRMPGRHAIQGWSCGCKWGAYHWGANDDFSRFAGRMCSHALALQYEAQSRGMFGRDVRTDDAKPSWTKRMVVVKHDIDGRRDIEAPSTKVGSLDTVVATLVTHVRGQDFADVSLAFTAAGLDLGAAIRTEAAVNDAWGEPQPDPARYQRGPTKPSDPNENPASAGWASAPEPESWGQAGPSGLTHMVSSRQDDDAIFEPELGKEAFLPLLAPMVAPLVGGGAAAGAAGVGAAEVAGAGAARAIIPKMVDKAAPAIINQVVKQHEQEERPKGPEQPQAPVGENPVDDNAANPLNYGARAELHEEPEGALPSTDGDLEDAEGVASIVAQFQATAGAQGLQSGSSGPAAPSNDGLDIAAAARQFLETGDKPAMQTFALKAFTPAEQQRIINEGENVRAANLDRLDIAGTHYEPLEAALASADDDEEWMS